MGSYFILYCFINSIPVSALLGLRSDSNPATVTINNDAGGICPSQSQIDLKLSAAKTEIQNIIANISEWRNKMEDKI